MVEELAWLLQHEQSVVATDMSDKSDGRWRQHQQADCNCRTAGRCGEEHPALAAIHEAPASMIQYVAPVLTGTHAAPHPKIKFVALAVVIENSPPAPAVP